WRSDAWGRREVFSKNLEQLADETFRRPIGKADLAGWLAYAQQFGGRAILVGREHHAERGDHVVESIVLEWQCFSVGLSEFNLQAFSCGARATALQQRGHVVGGSDFAPPARSCQCDVAVTGGDVEHFPPGA